MNQNDQMREALRNNIRGFLCERTGMFKFVLSDAECHEGWKEMMLIPNLPNEVIDSVLSHVNETPKIKHDSDDVLTKAGDVDHIGDANKMVRLTDDFLIETYLLCKAEWKATNKRQRERIAIMFGNALQDAMIKKNGGAHATD